MLPSVVMPKGSSPLARGLQGARLAAVAGLGIIPARAGFTSVEALAGTHVEDHPRSRGVYEHVLTAAEVAAGSSPLARGLHLRILGIPTMTYPIRPLLPSLVT